MKHLLEGLESRTLLSAASPQAAALLADRAALQAMVKADKASIAANLRATFVAVRTLSADLRKAGGAQNRSSAVTFALDTDTGVALLTRDLHKLLAVGTSAGQRLVADALQLAQRPGNAALMARINAEGSTLLNLSLNNAFAGDAGSVQDNVTADLNQIGSNNPSNARIQADVNADLALVQSIASTVQDQGNALLNELGTLFNDIRALAPAG
jgi:hypothetical protein